MKVHINVDENASELEVQINCNRLTPEIEKILSVLRMMDMQLTVRKDDEIILLDINKVLYIDVVERKTFVYTEKDLYESDLRLYELEERLAELGFFRISKASMVNLKKIKSLRTEINRRLRLTLLNDEQIIVSRMYAEELRKRLGVV